MDNNNNKLLFPILNSTIEINNNTKVLNCDWHNELEFILIERGSAMFKVENSYFEALEGEIVIINSNEIHSAHSANDSPCICKTLKFNLNILSSKNEDLIQVKFINPLLDKKIFLPNLISGNEINKVFIKEMLENLFHIIESKNPNYELLVKSYLYMIFSKLILLSKSVPLNSKITLLICIKKLLVIYIKITIAI